MRIRRRLSAVVAGLVLSLSISWGVIALASPAGWSVKQLTFGAGVADPASEMPQVSEGRVAWIADDGSNSEVWTWKVGDLAPTQITFDSNSHVSPQVSGDRVAWIAQTPTGNDVWTWTPSVGSTKVPFGGYATDLHLSGDRICWSNYVNPAYQVWTWKAGDPNAAQITFDPWNHFHLRISGDRIVWTESDGSHWQIWTWKAGPGAGQMTFDPYDHGSPDISGDRVVWTASVAQQNYEVITQDLNYPWTPVVSANAFGPPYDPVVSGGRIAWFEPAAVGHDIKTWKVGDASVTLLVGGASTPLIAGPALSGDRVAWVEPKASYGRLRTWKSGDATPTTLAENAFASHDGPLTAVSGDRVVWTGWDGAHYQVFTAGLQTPTFITKPSVSPSRPKHGASANFSASLSPSQAAALGASSLKLYRSETKWVKQKVRGKVRRVKVRYWRLRSVVRMAAGSGGSLTARAKLRYSGSWRALVAFGGNETYAPKVSNARGFKVR